jgi:CheY-like chemotaxis protein
MDRKKCDCEPRILVVDDNQFNIMVIKSMLLEDFGLEAEEAVNGYEALQMFETGMKKTCNC